VCGISCCWMCLSKMIESTDVSNSSTNVRPKSSESSRSSISALVGNQRTHKPNSLTRSGSMVCSGGRTNLKVWGAPVQSISGDTGPAGSAGKNVLVVPLHFFALKAQLVILVSAFLMVSIQFGQFLVAVLLLTVPPRAQSSVKVGRVRAPRAPWSRRH